MADLKISALTAASTPLAGTEVLPIVQSSSTVKVAVSNLTAGRAVDALSLQLTNAAGNVEPLVLSSGAIGVVGNTIGIRAGFSGTTYQKGGLIYQSADGNGRGAWNICCQDGANSANVSITDSILKIDYSGDVTAKTGNLVIGTSGKGIDFSATAGTGTSELLADYEEGTWTPAAGANLAIIGTPTFTGEYTKIGNTVTAWGSVSSTTSVAYTAGGQILSGLPFTAQGIIAVGTVINNAFTFSSSIATLPTTAFLYGAEAIAATTAIHFQVTYHV
jgi:hypothetical protein